MTVADETKYLWYRENRSAVYDLLLPALLLGSVGAITWAIRGTSGWGGVDGTIVPGMTWGLFWYYLCCRQGIDARAIPLWLGLGIAIGGGLGYGQYVSWIRGNFAVGQSTIPVSPLIGCMWLIICGIGWGGPGGIALGWALDGPASRGRWLARLLVPVGIAFGAWLLVKALPALFFPNYHLGIYTDPLDAHLLRTVDTNTKNFIVAAWWAGALLVGALQRDRATRVVGALIGGGFGIGFMLAALWCLGYRYAPNYIDWWKVWELNAGFYLGLLYAVALYWAKGRISGEATKGTYVKAGLPPERLERRRAISLIVAVFLLLFVMFFGATSRFSVVLGLCTETDVDQYAWPWPRVLLFIPFGALVLGVTVHRIRQTLRRSSPSQSCQVDVGRLANRMAELLGIIGIVGIGTIWPTKISVLYAVFLAAAFSAFTRLNTHFDAMDAAIPRDREDSLRN